MAFEPKPYAAAKRGPLSRLLDSGSLRRRRPALLLGLAVVVILFLVLPRSDSGSAHDANANPQPPSGFSNRIRQSLSKYHVYPAGEGHAAAAAAPPPAAVVAKPDQAAMPLTPVKAAKALGPMLRDMSKPQGTFVSAAHRAIDLADGFEGFNRSWPWCYMDSRDLHEPFEPLCDTKRAVLDAMTDGGRAGVDSPFQPRGCDMRWFNTEEICEILSKYSYVWLLGDSLMRHATSAMHTLIREDLILGGYTKWRPNPGFDCTCAGANDNGACFANEAWSSREVWDEDPTSIVCPKNNVARIEYTVQNKYPLDKDALHGYRLIMPKEEPAKPMAFIFGTGLWNDLNVTAAEGWLDQLDTLIADEMPWTQGPGAVYPRLFMTPSAGGENKPMQYAATQGNQAMIPFEKRMRAVSKKRGLDFVGTYNMTIQTNSPDGTHAGRKADMVKAMMVLNWLKWVDT